MFVLVLVTGLVKETDTQNLRLICATGDSMKRKADMVEGFYYCALIQKKYHALQQYTGLSILFYKAKTRQSVHRR